MKTIILILALLTFSLPSFGQFAACGDYLSNISKAFEPLFANGCSERFKNDEAGYCNCLAQERDKNEIKQAISKSVGSIEAFNAKNLEKNKKHLLNIYNKLNYEVSFQESKFQMNSNELKVGCTPEQMGKHFNQSIEKQNELMAQQTKGGVNIGPPKKSVAELNLDVAKDFEKTQIVTEINTQESSFVPFKAAAPSPETVNSSDMTQGKVAYGGLIANVGAKIRSVAGNGVNSLAAACAMNSANSHKSNEVIVKKLTKARSFFGEHPGLLVTTDLANLDKIIEELGYDCVDVPLDLIDQIDREYISKVKYSPKAFKRADTTTASEKIATIDFKKTNDELKNKFSESLLNTPPGGCIDYHQFKTYNSAPKQDLIDKLSGQNILALIDPGNIRKAPVNDPIVNFLKKNPVIAKNTINPSQRALVAKSLESLMGKMKNVKNPKDRFVLYADFMKNDIAKINKTDKDMDLLQCDLLAQNYAAISSSNEIPALGLLEGGDLISNIASQYIACKIRDDHSKQNKPSPSIQELINANDLFALFDEDPISASDDKEYTDFLANTCPDYEKFVSTGIKWKCLLRSGASCKNKVADVNDRMHKIMRAKYFKQHGNIKELSDLIDNNSVNISPGLVEDINNKTNSEFQDLARIKEYETTIKPALNNRSIYSTDNLFRPSASESGNGQQNKTAGQSTSSNSSSDAEAPIFKSIAQAQDNYNHNNLSNGSGNHINSGMVGNLGNSSSDPISSGSNVTPSNNAISQGAPVNPGQFTPAFMNGPVNQAIIPKASPTISSVEDVKDLVDDKKDIPLNEQKDLINQAKEVLATQNPKSAQIMNLNQKIAEMEKNIEKQTISPTRSNPGRSIANYDIKPNVAPSGIVNRPSPIGNSSNQSSSGKIASSSVSKSAASFNKALKQMHEKDKISMNENSSLEIQRPLGKSELKGGVVVAFEISPDSDIFALISKGGPGNEKGEALRAYLLNKKLELPEGQAISIKCQDTNTLKCDPNANEMVITFIKDGKNNFVMRSIASDVPVVRTSTISYKDLTNTMELETKTKVTK